MMTGSCESWQTELRSGGQWTRDQGPELRGCANLRVPEPQGHVRPALLPPRPVPDSLAERGEDYRAHFLSTKAGVCIFSASEFQREQFCSSVSVVCAPGDLPGPKNPQNTQTSRREAHASPGSRGYDFTPLHSPGLCSLLTFFLPSDRLSRTETFYIPHANP